MAREEVRTGTVNLADIRPDPNQPRKNFNPERMAELIASIKKYGIISPLVVEKAGAGKYILVDGERRYRAATEIGLKVVPVIVRDEMDETERLIQQFHLQEQHEGWSATEKAVAVSELADRLGVSVRALAEMLSLPERTISNYVSFAQLLDRKEFVKSEIPVGYASSIIPLRVFVKKVFQTELEKDFTQEMEKKLERAIIARIKSGDIRHKNDITKIRDSVKAQPKALLKFIDDEELSVHEMFLKTDAKMAYAYRNLMATARAVETYTNSVMKLGSYRLLSDADKKALQRVRENIAALIT